MHRYFAVISLLVFSAGAGAAAQSAPTVAPTQTASPAAATATAPSAASACAGLHLVPAPRECMGVEVIPIGGIGFFVSAGKNAEDGFTAEDLIESSMGKRTVEKDAPFVRLERADSAEAQALLAQHHLSFDPAMHDEGYVIVPDGQGGLAVIAETSAGIFYGAQTVKQLIRGSGKEEELLAPTLRDWPAMVHRGLSDDWSRGPLPNMEFLKREIRTLAAYKINIFSPYFESSFAYDSSPVAAFPGGAMSPEEARELVEYAARYHIMVIPEQESFGHLHSVLKYEQFSSLGETPHGAVLAPGDPATLPLIADWFSELAKVFPGPYMHIGGDETFELGLGKTRAQVQQQGLGAVYLGFLNQIHTTLEPDHKRLLFWGDIAVHSPELVGTLPKDMIAVPWEYDARADFKPIIEPFTKAGLETWVAPGVNNWNRLYPNNAEALANIRAFVRDGQALGSTGVLNTVWNDDGEGIFDENWFGVLFGAAAGWQAGESSEDNFVASFGQAFHRDPTGRIDQAQRELMAAHAAFALAGLDDAEDAYFWVDPYSPEGERVAVKLRPVESQLRLHAERAITLVAEARAAARQENRTLENPGALDALELGARRIDFVGLKFQEADEAGDLLDSANQRANDIFDGYMTLRELYRQAWLRDNRPYWLGVNLARYDRAAQVWMGRGERMNLAIGQWWETHMLPAAAEAGLPGPPELQNKSAKKQNNRKWEIWK